MIFTMENNDWSNYIYIILAALFGIVGKFANKKKDKKKFDPFNSESSKPATSKGKDFMDTVFDTFFEEEEEVEKEVIADEFMPDTVEEPVRERALKEDLVREESPEPEQPQYISLADERKAYTESYNKQYNFRQEEKKPVPKVAEPPEEQEKKEPLFGKDNSDTDFDLEKAVIYSEILNRKYI